MGIWGKLRSAFGGESEDHAQTSAPSKREELFAAEVEAAIRAQHPMAVVKKHPEAFGFLWTSGEGSSSCSSTTYSRRRATSRPRYAAGRSRGSSAA